MSGIYRGGRLEGRRVYREHLAQLSGIGVASVVHLLFVSVVAGEERIEADVT